ncbi:5-hydroxytryptamine receptor 3C-like [Dromiciops gliroides]|uniref:5-hydroxytryptamine receptor 3C-like n=1 Tax=Dromiciops gliroides TaxID=33562 RepID=UPI001CC4B218|nr:5-hydroxytryptamine receptor 3C-like [Dromiciops gliroides]
MQHWPLGFLICLFLSFLLPGRGHGFTINCSGFDYRGVDPTVFASVIGRKDFRPVLNYSFPTYVNISFTMSSILDVDEQLQLLTSFLWLDMVWDNAFISWNPEECGGIQKISVTTQNLWLPDIFIIESVDVDQTPTGLTAYVSNEGRIKYKKPMRVTSICNLDIFRFPFDQQNCTLTFSSFLYTVDDMLLGMEKELWEIVDTSRNLIMTQGEWELLGINKATPKMSVGSSLYDQIMFHVAIKRRPGLYVVNLLLPSGFLIAIDALSFLLPVESGNRAPFKMTLLLGYTVFLLMMNDLLPASGIPLISVYFALCLTLMVTSLLESVFLTYLLHVVTTQPPPMPHWLYSLVLRYIKATECFNKRSQKENKGPGPNSIHLPGLKDPVVVTEWKPGPGKAGLNGDPQSPWTEPEQQNQRQRTVDMWVKFSLALDTMLFWLYLSFMSSSLTTIIILWKG